MSLWLSLCSALLLPSHHTLPPCFDSSDRIQPLGLLKPKEQEGNDTTLGMRAFKKCVSIKDSLFLGKKCFRQGECSAHPQQSLSFPGSRLRF